MIRHCIPFSTKGFADFITQKLAYPTRPVKGNRKHFHIVDIFIFIPNRHKIFQIWPSCFCPINDLTSAISLDERYADAYYLRALSYYETKDPGQSIADASRALQYIEYKAQEFEERRRWPKKRPV